MCVWIHTLGNQSGSKKSSQTTTQETKNICKALDFKKWNNCYGKTNLAYDYKMGWGGKNPSNIEGIYEGFWINGLKDGQWKYWYDSGKILKEEMHENGEMKIEKWY